MGTVEVERAFPRYTRIENQVIEDARLRPRDVMVYLVLAYHGDNKSRDSFPSLATVGKRAGLSPCVLRDSMRTLERLGYLKRTPRPGSSTLYRVGLLTAPPDEIHLKDGTRRKVRKARGMPFKPRIPIAKLARGPIAKLAGVTTPIEHLPADGAARPFRASASDGRSIASFFEAPSDAPPQDSASPPAGGLLAQEPEKARLRSALSGAGAAPDTSEDKTASEGQEAAYRSGKAGRVLASLAAKIKPIERNPEAEEEMRRAGERVRAFAEAEAVAT